MRRFTRLLDIALTEAVDEKKLEDIITRCLQAMNHKQTDKQAEAELDAMSNEPDFLAKLDEYLTKAEQSGKWPNANFDEIRQSLAQAYGGDNDKGGGGNDKDSNDKDSKGKKSKKSGPKKPGFIKRALLAPLEQMMARGMINKNTTYSAGNG